MWKWGKASKSEILPSSNDVSALQQAGDRPVTVKILVSSQPQHRKRQPDVQEKLEKPAVDPSTPTSDRPNVKVLVSSRLPRRSRPQLPPPQLDDWDEEEDEDDLEDDLEDELEDESSDRPKIRVLASSAPRRAPRRLKAALLLAVLVGAGSLVAGGGWVAFQLIINPGSIAWMQWALPEWNRNSLDKIGAPQTMGKIREQAKEAGLFLGEPLPLGDTGALVIPVSTQMLPCSGLEAIAPSSGCGRIDELRVYQPYTESSRQGLFELVDRLATPGLEEYKVVAPADTNEGSSQILPLTAMSLVDGKAPTDGIWFQLSGEWMRGSTRIVYGQVMGYDRLRTRLETRLQWTSPAGNLPRWQEVTGDGSTELVVNQTLGLEPNLKAYRVKSQASAATSIQLEPITLSRPAIKSRSYENALTLARGGLWNPALQTLQTIKNRSQGKSPGWSSTAQAQMDVIRLHANITKAQADQAWASPSEHMTALVIDGRWQDALRRLQAAIKDGYDTSTLLRDDSKTLWRRVNAALKVNRNQIEVQAWGALIVTTQQGRRAAIAWLQAQQPKTSAASQPGAIDSRLQTILNLVSTLSSSETVATHPSRLVGSVSRSASINPQDWTVTQPNTRLALEGQQAWYQIRVSRFHDGQRWWRSPFNALSLPPLGIANELWDLIGLVNDPSIQIISWAADGQLQTTQATVKAIRFRSGTLQLLAAGDSSLNDRAIAAPLAITSSTLRWLEPTNLLTLAELNQQQPTWAAAIVPTLWQELQNENYVSQGSMPDLATLLTEIGSWSVQLIDLTGNGQAEVILTVQPGSLASSQYASAAQLPNSNSMRSRTLIFSDEGTLIYSELSDNRNQEKVAIADLEDGNPPALVLNTSQSYVLKQWSLSNRRFE